MTYKLDAFDSYYKDDTNGAFFRINKKTFLITEDPNDGYRMPVYIDGKLSWVTKNYLHDWVKYEGGKLEDITPAFKTSLNVDKFMESLKNELGS